MWSVPVFAQSVVRRGVREGENLFGVSYNPPSILPPNPPTSWRNLKTNCHRIVCVCTVSMSWENKNRNKTNKNKHRNCGRLCLEGAMELSSHWLVLCTCCPPVPSYLAVSLEAIWQSAYCPSARLPTDPSPEGGRGSRPHSQIPAVPVLIQHGLVHEFQSNINCDTRSANQIGKKRKKKKHKTN